MSELYKEKNIKYFHLESENYPELLKNIQKKPACIFYLGDMDRCCFNRTLAIVGSRKLSNNVSKVLKNIMEPLANSDICIISGLAQGADTFAHKYALENNLSTIAVLGSGFDKLYPIENKNLFSEIIEKYGVVMTEYWPTFEPIHWRFPLRNRIVTGLSYGTLIVEARLRSGAMISANLCLDEGRELMCIPGDLLNPNTEGIYKLLKSGATIVTCAEDILDTLNWQKTKMTYSEVKDLNLNDLEYNIYETIKMNSPSFDEIIYKTSCNADELMLHLTTLELKGLIRQVDGSKYIVN